MRDVVAAGNLADSLAVLVAAADRLALLVVGQLRFAAELDVARLGPLAAFASAGADQIALHLGEAADNGNAFNRASPPDT